MGVLVGVGFVFVYIYTGVSMALVLGVDVGVAACGYSFVEVKKNYIKVKAAEICLPVNQKADWNIRLCDLIDGLDSLHDSISAPIVDHVYIECPELFSGERGKVSSRQNYNVHMACHMGMVAQWAWDWSHTGWTPIIPQKWKGNMTNEAVWSRIKIRFNKDGFKRPIEDHALDATGIAICGHKKTNMKDPLWLEKK